MRLNLNQIKEITKGAVRIEENEGFLSFYRFTEEQEEMYKGRSADFYKKTFATAGVKLLFKTDSKNLKLKGKVQSGSSRKYYSIDVFVDGNPVGYIDNFEGIELPKDYAKTDLPMGDFSKSIELGKGEKTVCVYLPWSMAAKLEEISVDDGSFVDGVKLDKKLIAFGDSITHGYDALRPSNRYISRIAESLGAEEINKAIGGEVFWEDLAKTKEDFMPDYIAVSYGSNDWNKRTKEDFEKSCREFYTSLRENYPTAKIFAISPIWRKDYNKENKFGNFLDAEKFIKEVADSLDNVTFISGFDFVPHDEKYYADLYLHPNDEGFDYQFENLNKKIKEAF